MHPPFLQKNGNYRVRVQTNELVELDVSVCDIPSHTGIGVAEFGRGISVYNITPEYSREQESAYADHYCAGQTTAIYVDN